MTRLRSRESNQSGVVWYGDQPERTQGEGRRRILVVDDNKDARDYLAVMLELSDHIVEVASDGLEAIERARDFRPDVILLDIQMPGVDGHRACEHIRGQDWGRSIMILAVTGLGGDDDLERSRRAGFDAHVTKPVDPAMLMRLV